MAAGQDTSMELAEQLTAITTSLAGSDARSAVEKMFVRKMMQIYNEAADPRFFNFYCDDIRYMVACHGDVWDHEDLHVYATRIGDDAPDAIRLAVQRDPSEFGQGHIGTDAAILDMGHEVFETILAGNHCCACKGLIKPTDTFCDWCAFHWHTVGCSVCGGHVGPFKEGKHPPCQVATS